MRVDTFFPTPQDKIFAIALSFVALFGTAEVLTVAAYYIGRVRAEHVAARATASHAPPNATVAAPAPAQSAPPAPGAAESPASAAALSAGELLLKEATALRERGDTANALARLQEAAQRDPKDANVLAEMATIYESVQLFDRSNETWHKIQEIGPSAGGFYELAEMKLKTGVPAPAPETATGPGLAGASPLDAGTTRNDSEGIPDGSTFGITEVTAAEVPDLEAETNMKLKIAVKARPNAAVDHTKVKIQVFFYDVVDNKDVVLTDADVSYEWLTPQHDWKETNPEVLAVTYVRPKKTISSDAVLSAAASAVTPAATGRKKNSPKPKEGAAEFPGDGSRRKYFGYIVRVYYNDQLQAVRADPTKLLSLPPAQSH